jgi:ACS family tartrate transporter-like MFS transporter
MPIEAESELQRSTLRKIRNRCVVPLLFAFIVSYLDRVNVGFAAITANEDLGMTASQYGWGAGLLFLGYSLFELPSNLALERFGARRWLARIMITWGVIGCAMAWVGSPLSFYALRFLLGVAEAGLFPGVILYLTYWLPRRLRARYLGLFALGIPLSSVIGSPISGVIMASMQGVLGLKSWQWLYILEAIPAVLIGLWVLAALADRPANARWLTDGERSWLRGQFEREAPSVSVGAHRFTWKSLGDRRVLTLAAVFFLTGVPSYGLSLWLPQIVKSFGVSHIVTGVLSAVPFVFGSIAMVYWGHRSDARGERVWHTIVPATVAGIALIGGALLTSGVMQLVAVCVAAAGIYAIKGPFLTIVSESFSDERAAAGIAMVTTLGNLSGFVAPYMVGMIIEATGGHRAGLAALGAQSVLGALVLFGAASAVKGSGASANERAVRMTSAVRPPAESVPAIHTRSSES